MKNIIEVSKMNIEINQAEKEKSLNTIMNKIMVELESKSASKSLLEQIKNVFSSKAFGSVALAGLSAVVVLSPVNSVPLGGAIGTPGGAGEDTVPSEPNEPPVIIGGDFASTSTMSTTTSVIFDLKDEYIPTSAQTFELYNGDQFVKELTTDDVKDNELMIDGLVPDTTYNDFELRFPNNGSEAMVISVKLTENNAEITFGSPIKLGEVSTKVDEALVDVINEAKEREESGVSIGEGHEFTDGEVYIAGDKVMHNELEYEAMWWTMDTPAESNLAWKLISVEVGIDGNEVYNASRIYEAGNTVELEMDDGSFDVYSANWWTQGVEPTRDSLVWEYIETIHSDGGVVVDRTWTATNIYKMGDVVIHNNIIFTAKWWNQGVEPNMDDLYGAWTFDGYVDGHDPDIDVDDENLYAKWSSKKTYTEGMIVEHEGEYYRAKFWTKNHEPGKKGHNNPWEMIKLYVRT